MDIGFLKNKKVAVLGLGLEGKAVTRYLLKHGIKPVLFDQDVKVKNEIVMFSKHRLKTVFGKECFKKIQNFDCIFRSPGIKLNSIPKQKHTIITSQTKWFFEHCPSRIIGITGTKGKGTTATLIYKILKLARSKIKDNAMGRVFLTGNIGKIQALEILDELKPSDYVVCELSSFQLQDLTYSPHIGVVLMVTSEHLDYHLNRGEYVKAKSAITKFQRVDNLAIINADFKNSMAIGKLGNAQKLYFSRKKSVKTGSCVIDGHIVIVGTTIRIPISDLHLRGEHNLENVCAAVLAAYAAWADDESILEGVKNFKGLEHRLEYVAEKNGIKFYNDSFSTTPETAIAAIKAFREPEILILGGSSKKSDFSELVEVIGQTKNLKTIILIGEESKLLKRLLKKKYKGTLLDGAQNFEQIFEQIKSVAKPGDAVLLSPACASFDMFKNYSDRGEQFSKFARKYK